MTDDEFVYCCALRYAAGRTACVAPDLHRIILNRADQLTTEGRRRLAEEASAVADAWTHGVCRDPLHNELIEQDTARAWRRFAEHIAP